MTNKHEEYSMVTITLHCPHCGSDALVRDGHAPDGKQKSRCHARGRRSRENPPPNAYPEARREEILDASQECRSLRVSRLRLASRVRPCRVGSKQRSSASSLTSHLGRPGPREADFYDIGTG